jgi:hypothetical protein
MPAKILTTPSHIHLGDNIFVNIIKSNQSTRVQLYNAASPTPHEVSFQIEDWRRFSNRLESWKIHMEDTNCPLRGVLFSRPEFAIIKFVLDGIKTISFLHIDRKQIDLTLQQFKVLCASIDAIDAQISGPGLKPGDSH